MFAALSSSSLGDHDSLYLHFFIFYFRIQTYKGQFLVCEDLAKASCVSGVFVCTITMVITVGTTQGKLSEYKCSRKGFRLTTDSKLAWRGESGEVSAGGGHGMGGSGCVSRPDWH